MPVIDNRAIYFGSWQGRWPCSLAFVVLDRCGGADQAEAFSRIRKAQQATTALAEPVVVFLRLTTWVHVLWVGSNDLGLDLGLGCRQECALIVVVFSLVCVKTVLFHSARSFVH